MGSARAADCCLVVISPTLYPSLDGLTTFSQVSGPNVFDHQMGDLRSIQSFPAFRHLRCLLRSLVRWLTVARSETSAAIRLASESAPRPGAVCAPPGGSGTISPTIPSRT